MDKRVIPRQLLQFVVFPVLGNLIIIAFFHSSGSFSSTHILSSSGWISFAAKSISNLSTSGGISIPVSRPVLFLPLLDYED
jgi:hypothetical protein